jgi:hypothetical protein
MHIRNARRFQTLDGCFNILNRQRVQNQIPQALAVFIKVMPENLLKSVADACAAEATAAPGKAPARSPATASVLPVVLP